MQWSRQELVVTGAGIVAVDMSCEIDLSSKIYRIGWTRVWGISWWFVGWLEGKGKDDSQVCDLQPSGCRATWIRGFWRIFVKRDTFILVRDVWEASEIILCAFISVLPPLICLSISMSVPSFNNFSLILCFDTL